jgi:hypothetical protein
MFLTGLVGETIALSLIGIATQSLAESPLLSYAVFSMTVLYLASFRELSSAQRPEKLIQVEKVVYNLQVI